MSESESYTPIDYWDWRLLNSQTCEACEGSGKNPLKECGSRECPACLVRYQRALLEDRAKWKLHTLEPVFFVTAEAASKTAHYLPSY